MNTVTAHTSIDALYTKENVKKLQTGEYRQPEHKAVVSSGKSKSGGGELEIDSWLTRL